MLLAKLSFPVCLGLLAGCATPQLIYVETAPEGAAISVDTEYVGRSPTNIKVEDVDSVTSFRIVAEKGDYDAASKTITKQPNGKFPKQVFLKLDQTAYRTGGGFGQQQGGNQTTIQGPTIVIPGATQMPTVIPAKQ